MDKHHILMRCPSCGERDFFELGTRSTCQHCGYPDKKSDEPLQYGLAPPTGSTSLTGGVVGGLVVLGVVRVIPYLLLLLLWLAGFALVSDSRIGVPVGLYVLGGLLLLGLGAVVAVIMGAGRASTHGLRSWWFLPVPGFLVGFVGYVALVLTARYWDAGFIPFNALTAAVLATDAGLAVYGLSRRGAAIPAPSPPASSPSSTPASGQA